MFKIIILGTKNRAAFGGGDVHMDKLSSIYQEKFGINVTRIMVPFPNKEFNVTSNIISIASATFLPVDEKYKEMYQGAIIVVPNPYPNYLITALKISKLVGG